MTTPADAFVDALAAKDEDRLRAVLTEDVDFRGLTPSEAWQGTGRDAVLEVLLGRWFEPHDEIVEVREVHVDTVGDRDRVTYRLGLSCHGEPRVTEQHAVFETDDRGRIGWLRIMCSGFRPDGATR
jgi:hypothetical protein